MATISIDVPDASALRLLNGLCTRWGYTGANTNAAKIAFVKSITINWWKENLASHEADTAAALTRQTTITEISNINIT